MNRNNIYEAPEATVVCLEEIDVITASLPIFKDDNVLEDGWIPA